MEFIRPKFIPISNFLVKIVAIGSGPETFVIRAAQRSSVDPDNANRFDTQRADRFRKIILRPFSSGGILYALGHISFIDRFAFESVFIFVLIELAALLSGLIPFGISNLRRPILAHWQWRPLATGVLGFIGFFWSAERRSQLSSSCPAPCSASGFSGLAWFCTWKNQ
jgi:hypothetical protein